MLQAFDNAEQPLGGAVMPVYCGPREEQPLGAAALPIPTDTQLTDLASGHAGMLPGAEPGGKWTEPSAAWRQQVEDASPSCHGIGGRGATAIEALVEIGHPCCKQ